MQRPLTWDPTQYGAFAGPRLRPALDLIARLPQRPFASVLDLGCGTGEITALLAELHPTADVSGVDSSPQMLERSRALETRARFELADLNEWRPERPAELVFSNATLHWIPDHASFLPRLLTWVAPGGCLAIQVPNNFAAPSHALMHEVLAHGGAGGAPLGPPELRARLATPPVRSARWYRELLWERTAELDLWETEYLHVLEGEDPVLEWVRGTGLRPVLAALGEQERTRFLGAYAGRLREAYPPGPDGRTAFPFRRLFLVAEV